MRSPSKAPPAPNRPSARRVAAALLLATFAGCAGEGDTLAPGPDPGEPASFSVMQEEIFDQRCTSATCHAAGTLAGGLSLASDDSYDALVNVEPENSAAEAAGWLRVVPNDPERSFLLRKLTGELGPGEGSPMPLGGAPLSESQIEMIRAWIEDGAPRDD